MNTYNICICKENQKKKYNIASSNMPLIKSFADLTLKCAFKINILLQVFSSNFEKPKCTV